MNTRQVTSAWCPRTASSATAGLASPTGTVRGPGAEMVLNVRPVDISNVLCLASRIGILVPDPSAAGG